MATTTADHPLKGIINTNDDPFRCAICQDSFGDASDRYTNHEGRDSCETCGEDGQGLLLWDRLTYRHLKKGQANIPCPKNRKLFLQSITRKARKGQAWAQFIMGQACMEGYGGTISFLEGVHWFRLASDQGHPIALLYLGISNSIRNDDGRDLSKAQELIERATASPFVNESPIAAEYSRHALIELAIKYMDLETEEANRKAKSLLLPLVEEGSIKGNAQGLLGQAFYRESDAPAALKWFSLAATDPDIDSQLISPEIGALRCCVELGKIAQAKFWGRFSKKILSVPNVVHDVRLTRVQILVDLRRRLRALRDACGGCGSAFEGKERKFCRGCRAYCYCSRECQKMHWDRKKDGHREDCKGAMELKQKMKEKKMKEASGTKITL